MRNKNVFKKGFTLIELLVVIAIIGILSSIALTSLNSSRAKARDARTAQELHQIDLAMQDYLLNEGNYPQCEAGDSSPESCCIGQDSCVEADGQTITGRVDFVSPITMLPDQPEKLSNLAVALGANLDFTDGDRNYIYYSDEDLPTISFPWSQTNSYKVLPADELYNFNQANNVQPTDTDLDDDGILNSNEQSGCAEDPDCDDDNVGDGSEIASQCIQDPDCDDDGTNDDTDPCPTDDTNMCNLVYGCTNSDYLEYNPLANTDDGTCVTLKVPGCTNSGAINYNSMANFDDGSCYYTPGCTDSNANNYNSMADHDDGSCTYNVYGCTNQAAYNYNSSANIDDGSCYFTPGCTNPNASNYNSMADHDDGSCVIYGCTDSNAMNYNPEANSDDGSCAY